jgi:cellulose synthase operon protein YhjU
MYFGGSMVLRDVLERIDKQFSNTRHVVLWNFYFLFKIYLFIIGAINLDIPFNLLLLVFILLPVGSRISLNNLFMFCKTAVWLVLAFILLWRDSWLPSISDTRSLIQEHGMPSYEYILSFIKGGVSMSLVIFAAGLLLVSYLLSSYKRVSIVIMAVIITVVPLAKSYYGLPVPGQKEELDVAEAAEKDPGKYLEAFYAKESERTIVFKQPGAPAFDLIILHLCSLSWDDMREIGMTQDDPLFKEFDYLFTNFNSATGYSGPAVIRLLQSNGGQRSHQDIHSSGNTPKEFFLFESLASVGYERYIAMDHDGKYGNYNIALKKNGLNGAKLIKHDGLSSPAIFFDGKTPLYKDLDMFKKWLEARNESKAERATLYFNSVLMHAGSHWVEDNKWATREPRGLYKELTTEVLKDMKKMIDFLKTSKRNTVLVLVSEHGRALTGSPFQPPDMRDIPLPKITKVPMAVKLIGPKFNSAKVNQTIISKPTSYFALSWMLSKFVEHSPFGATPDSPQDLAAKIPKTDFVSENETGKVVETGGVYHYYGKSKKWVALTPEQLK